jgi:hypothetical protein
VRTQAVANVVCHYTDRHCHSSSMDWLCNHTPVVNHISDRFSATGLDGTPMPDNRSVDPIVRTRRIGARILTTDRRLDQTLFTRVHLHDLGFAQATVTVLSIICPCTHLQCGQVKVRKSWPSALGSIAVNFIGEPQAVHCGPWFCVSSIVFAPSGRCPEFAAKPTGRARFEGIRCSDTDLNLIAFGAFEQSVFEADRAGRNPFQYHPRLAAGTARAFNGGQELLGRGHGAFPCTEAGALPDSLSPMVAYGGAAIY